MEIRNDRLYTESHEWVKLGDDQTATIGLSDYAQQELGDLVFVNLPQEGDTFAAGDMMADVESVKAVSDVYCPVGGEVAAINEGLLDNPAMINQIPYDAWLVRISQAEVPDGLMDADAYRAFLAQH